MTRLDHLRARFAAMPAGWTHMSLENADVAYLLRLVEVGMEGMKLLTTITQRGELEHDPTCALAEHPDQLCNCGSWELAQRSQDALTTYAAVREETAI